MSRLRNKNIQLLTPFNLVAYTIGALVLGIFVGFGFGHFERQRFELIREKLVQIKSDISALEKDYTFVKDNFNTTTDKQTLIPSAEILKKRGFSSFCSTSNYTSPKIKWITIRNYTKSPQTMELMSGLSINLASETNLIQSEIEVDHQKKSINYWGTFRVNNFKPNRTILPVCVLSIPGPDYE